MKSKIFSIIKYVFFLGLGVFLFWWSYRDEDFGRIIGSFRDVNYFWIGVSLLISILSLVFRARRWQLLISASGNETRFSNVFLSCFILYFVNLLLPRAGEVARCSVVSGTEKVPFAKLVGTMVVERLADMIMLMLIAVVVIPLRFSDFVKIMSSDPKVQANFESLFSLKNMFFLMGIGVVMLLLLYLLYKKYWNSEFKLIVKIKKVWGTIRQGIISIVALDKKWAFAIYTCLIFIMWLLMLYAVFLAFEPTSHLGIMAGVITFFMGGLAMLAPINGGIGAWHTMVIISLVGAYGIAESDATPFAFIAHTTTNLVYLVLGLFAVGILYYINKGKVSLLYKSNEQNTEE